MRLFLPLGRLLAICAFFAVACDRPAQATQAAETEAASQLPPLTGRVVDDAELLETATEVRLAKRLAELEAATSDQLVVVTVPSLGSESIEAFGLRLGNGWGVGQKEKSNGVLLIVAPAERKVRIEVGRGLENVLTDHASAQIIDQVILPHFRDAELERGIVAGSEAIIGRLQAPRKTSRDAAS